MLYAALGDSTGVGVGARGGGYPARILDRLREHRRDAHLLNLCVSGARARDVLRGQVERLRGAKPDIVTLAIGINDVSWDTGDEAFARTYAEILARIRVHAPAPVPVLACDIPDLSVAPVVPAPLRPIVRERIIRYDTLLEERARKAGVTIVDLHDESARLLAAHPEYFSPDGFHPSDEGYEAWAEMMWPAVAKAVGISD